MRFLEMWNWRGESSGPSRMRKTEQVLVEMLDDREKIPFVKVSLARSPQLLFAPLHQAFILDQCFQQFRRRTVIGSLEPTRLLAFLNATPPLVQKSTTFSKHSFNEFAILQ